MVIKSNTNHDKSRYSMSLDAVFVEKTTGISKTTYWCYGFAKIDDQKYMTQDNLF